MSNLNRKRGPFQSTVPTKLDQVSTHQKRSCSEPVPWNSSQNVRTGRKKKRRERPQRKKEKEKERKKEKKEKERNKERKMWCVCVCVCVS